MEEESERARKAAFVAAVKGPDQVFMMTAGDEKIAVVGRVRVRRVRRVVMLDEGGLRGAIGVDEDYRRFIAEMCKME